jgi:peptide/nickel transport system substrate-binding protein
VVYRLPLNYYVNSLEAAQVIEQMWEQVGFNVSLEPVENWSLVREAGVVVEPWSNTHRMPDPIGSFVPQWGSDSGIQNNRRNPERSWKAPAEFNEQQHIIGTSTDPEERKAAYRAALDIWIDEAPGTMLYNPLETYAVKDNIEWKPYGLYYMDFRPYNLSIN